MIEMRENRYDDIRKDVVGRGNQKPQGAPEGKENDPAKTSGSRTPQEQARPERGENYEEYNSWS